MGMSYSHLTAAERTTLMVMLAEGSSQSAVAAHLRRDRSTISRELARNGTDDITTRQPYDAMLADQRARALREAPGRFPKLGADTPLFAVVADQLREGWSPEQIAGRLKRTFADDSCRTVSHETIYTAIYVMPRGALRSDLISLLRQAHAKRRPRARGQDRRGQIPDMVSLHVRQPEIEDRLIPGHWEGDLIKGARNQSSVGTLVERSSRLVLLARMDGATADTAFAGFTSSLNRVHGSMRKTLTYDQGKEMSRTGPDGSHRRHRLFRRPTQPLAARIQRNTNGLLRSICRRASTCPT
jgi:IS30 family transposase